MKTLGGHRDVRGSQVHVVRGGKRGSGITLRAASNDESFLREGVRSPLRVFGIGALWAGLISYIAFLAPGQSEAAQALDADLLAKLENRPAPAH